MPAQRTKNGPSPRWLDSANTTSSTCLHHSNSDWMNSMSSFPTWNSTPWSMARSTLAETSGTSTVKGQAKFEVYPGQPAADQILGTIDMALNMTKEKAGMEHEKTDHRRGSHLPLSGKFGWRGRNKPMRVLPSTPSQHAMQTAPHGRWGLSLQRPSNGCYCLFAPIPSNTTYLIDHLGRYVHS